eukprot:g35646.t1
MHKDYSYLFEPWERLPQWVKAGIVKKRGDKHPLTGSRPSKNSKTCAVVHSFFGGDYAPLGNWGPVTVATAVSIVQGLFGLELLGAKRLLTSRLQHFAERMTKPNYPDVLVLGNHEPPIIKDAS